VCSPLSGSAAPNGGVVASKKEFTEPVALLSTQPADLPLPRTALGRSFNLLALRARCVEEPMGEDRFGQDARRSDWRSLRSFSCQILGELRPTRAPVLGVCRRGSSACLSSPPRLVGGSTKACRVGDLFRACDPPLTRSRGSCLDAESTGTKRIAI
jgi:hypothetical protein